MARPQLLGTFEQQVLAAVLQVGEEAYPPLVLRWIEEHTGRSVNRGSLYVALDRLESKEFLRSRPDADEGRDGRPRRCLEVTPGGLVALREARASLMASWDGLESLLEGEP